MSRGAGKPEVRVPKTRLIVVDSLLCWKKFLLGVGNYITEGCKCADSPAE
jgi:hypothetical protein